jgi:hypothetical protein
VAIYRGALYRGLTVVETMLGESYAKELRKIPLADNNVKITSNISEGLCDQLIRQLKISRFALQADEAREEVKCAHLIIYV